MPVIQSYNYSISTYCYPVFNTCIIFIYTTIYNEYNQMTAFLKYWYVLIIICFNISLDYYD